MPTRFRHAALVGKYQAQGIRGVLAPELNPVEYLWAWLKRHALANYCPDSLTELHHGARAKLKSAQRRSSIIAACWTQAELF